MYEKCHDFEAEDSYWFDPNGNYHSGIGLMGGEGFDFVQKDWNDMAGTAVAAIINAQTIPAVAAHAWITKSGEYKPNYEGRNPSQRIQAVMSKLRVKK